MNTLEKDEKELKEILELGNLEVPKKDLLGELKKIDQVEPELLII